MSKHYEGICKDKHETKKTTIHNRSFGMPGCTPVWPRNNSQLSTLNSAWKLTINVSAINISINITSEVPITSVHSTIDWIKMAASM